MTTEELLPHIKALTEIEFANLMRDLRSHIEANNFQSCLEEGGAIEASELESYRSYADNAETIVSAQQEEIAELKFDLEACRMRVTELENEIEELKGNALLNQAENAARGI
jgi:hypothetical protein